MYGEYEINYEEPWYVIKDVDSGVTTQGETVDEAKKNLKDALELYNENNNGGRKDD